MKLLTQPMGTVVTTPIDRPLVTRHPEGDVFNPLINGYLPGITAHDGEDLDSYLLGVFEPVKGFRGTCIAITHRLDDAKDKLVVVAEGTPYNDSQHNALINFQECLF